MALAARFVYDVAAAQLNESLWTCYDLRRLTLIWQQILEGRSVLTLCAILRSLNQLPPGGADISVHRGILNCREILLSATDQGIFLICMLLRHLSTYIVLDNF